MILSTHNIKYTQGSRVDSTEYREGTENRVKSTGDISLPRCSHHQVVVVLAGDPPLGQV